MTVLFLHGAGGYEEDLLVADRLRGELGAGVSMPRLPEEDVSFAAWSTAIAAHPGPSAETVVGHSFGGSVLLKMLTETDPGVRRLVLLAAPDWGPDGWDVADYALPDDAARRLPADLSVALHHCRNDDIVDVSHVDLLAARLPAAEVFRHDRGGHQFDGDALAAVAHALRTDPGR